MEEQSVPGIGRSEQGKGGVAQTLHLPQARPAAVLERAESVCLADPGERAATDARTALELFDACLRHISPRGNSCRGIGIATMRSDERRAGKEGASSCRYRCLA